MFRVRIGGSLPDSIFGGKAWEAKSIESSMFLVSRGPALHLLGLSRDLLELSQGPAGPPWGLLGPSVPLCAVSEASWAVLGASWGTQGRPGGL